MKPISLSKGIYRDRVFTLLKSFFRFPHTKDFHILTGVYVDDVLIFRRDEERISE